MSSTDCVNRPMQRVIPQEGSSAFLCASYANLTIWTGNGGFSSLQAVRACSQVSQWIREQRLHVVLAFINARHVSLNAVTCSSL